MSISDIDIEQVIAYEGYDYKISNGKKGLQINIKVCPSCGRQDYKVYMNANTGLGNCFGCSKTFNILSFLKASRCLSKNEEVYRYLNKIKDVVSYKPKIPLKDYKLNKDWKLPLNRVIELEDDVPEYLKDRNVDSKICKRFDLRYCDYGFYEYEDFNGKSKFVDFSKRIIIPIYDINNELVTFQGRDVTGLSEKKYLFPNMLPGTGRYIYNASYALRNKAKVVVLSEGVFDVFAVTRALESDLKYRQYVACGTFGKHLSISIYNVIAEDQLSDLFKLHEGGVEEFVVLWDGEIKAVEAAILASLQLNSYGLFSTVARLMDGVDPADVDNEVILKAIDDRFKPTKLDLLKMRLTNEYS